MSTISTEVTRLLGIKTPVISAPMAMASGGDLAGQVTLAGGFGFIPGERIIQVPSSFMILKERIPYIRVDQQVLAMPMIFVRNWRNLVGFCRTVATKHHLLFLPTITLWTLALGFSDGSLTSLMGSPPNSSPLRWKLVYPRSGFRLGTTLRNGWRSSANSTASDQNRIRRSSLFLSTP